MRTKQNSKRIRTLRRQRLALALVTAMAAPMAMAQDLPQGGNVVAGSGLASIAESGKVMTITQDTRGAIINWYSFNIGNGYGVSFDQQFGNNSVTLNRVIDGTSASMINGTLSANGNVFIINSAGVVFGSSAQVNVGGLVASTLDIDDGNFNAGVISGTYDFASSGTTAGAIWNNGQLTAADGGTIALIGSKINNAGTITANNGSVVFGATSEVTLALDYYGDGLTQILVSGNGLGVSDCLVDCTGGITSSGNVFASGGRIEMHSNTMDGEVPATGLFVDPANGGRIWISGRVSAATSGDRRGSILIDAGMGNIDLGGVDGHTGVVSADGLNAGEDAGTIELRGNQLFTHLCYGNGPTDLCVANNRLGVVSATAGGTGGSAGEIYIDVDHLYHGGVFQAGAFDGSGGLIDITADYAEIYNRIFAFGNNGTGGTINIDANSVLLFRGQQPWLGGPGIAYWSASLLAYGTTTGGTVNIDTGSLVVTDLGDVVPQTSDVAPVINVTGQLGGNGGVININADDASIGDTWFADASGYGQGGSISITGDSIDLEGGLVAEGDIGGSVTTTTSGSLFVGSTAYVNAGTWLVHAPSVQIIPGSGSGSGSGAVLSDDALSSSLDGGTLVQLYADASMVSGASGSIQIGDGINIVHSTSEAAGLELRATAGIYGSEFNIESTGGPLDLSFTANANGGNPDYGTVSFNSATLTSNGGDIVMSGEGRGVYLEYSQVSSGAGDILITGSGDEQGALLLQTGLTSTGGNISIGGSSATGSGASLVYADINSGGGNITLNGDGGNGISVAYSDLVSAGGDIEIHGDGINSGSYFHDSIVDSGDGSISITGTASLDLAGYYPFGVALAGTTLTSTTGDISVIGDAVGGSGILFWTPSVMSPGITTTSGAISLTSTGANGLGLEGVDIATDTGDITIVGTATDVGATAGVFVGSSGLTTNGGDITITGSTAGGTGVWLYYGDLSSNGGDITVVGDGFQYGVQVWGGLVSSETGEISIAGTAAGADSAGINVRDGSFASTSGGISLTGSAVSGTGISFGSIGGSGNSITTTSGAIIVSSTGLLGLNVADVPFTTDTGDITLEGHSLSSSFGLRLADGVLVSNGGDITLIGSSVNSTGVLVIGGDIESGGGKISIEGASTYYDGVKISDSNIVSLGGNITIDGESQNGVSLTYGVVIDSDSSLASSGGDIDITGSSADGSGVWLEYMDLTTSGGDIELHGTGGQLGGVDVFKATVNSDGGNIEISGLAATATAVALAYTALTSGDGSIAISGDNFSTSSAPAVLLLDAALTSTSGDISLYGTSAGDIGIAFDPRGGSGSSINTATGDISLFGQGVSLGIVASGAVTIGTQGGDITLGGSGGTGAGLQLGSGTTIDADDGVVALSASNSGSSDAIILQGSIASTTGVNLSPFDEADTILLGAGNGFSVSSADLAMIEAPLLVIGSALHAGAIRVTEAVDWDGDLTLQNEGGTGGIDIQATVDVGDNILALASGGNISQTLGGGITAHSLLAIAGGNVALTAAQNNVTTGSLAGSAGGSFAYEDVDALAIGEVSSFGFNPLDNIGLDSLSATGIAAEGNVFVRAATGDLTLGANVSGAHIDLVAAGLFFNPAGATLTATDGWRIYASTPDGEERGGLQGDGEFDVFGCAFGDEICTGLNDGNQFIYQEPRLLIAPVAPESVAEWLDEDELYGTATDLLIAELCPVADAGDLLQSATGQDELAQEWMKSRRRLQLSNCIDSENVPGCRF